MSFKTFILFIKEQVVNFLGDVVNQVHFHKCKIWRQGKVVHCVLRFIVVSGLLTEESFEINIHLNWNKHTGFTIIDWWSNYIDDKEENHAKSFEQEL